MQIFDEVEKRRQISMAMIYPFMQKLREAQFPAPGNTVEIKSFIPESGTEVRASASLMSIKKRLSFISSSNSISLQNVDSEYLFLFKTQYNDALKCV